MTTEKFVLSCGMEMLVDYMPHLRSVASGLWVKCGSVYEDPSLAGASHFLEHMLFKGTSRRNSLQIASEMEEVGGVLNAFTGKEHTCFYARSLDEHFSRQLDLLADMYRNSLLLEEEFAREKNVIIEEINMYEDSPDEVAMDLFTGTIFPRHPYGPPISGTLESVRNLTSDQLRQHYHKFYTPANTVLSIAGNIEPMLAKEMAEEKFSGFKGKWQAPDPPIPQTASATAYIHKDTEQSHICLGFPGIPLGDDDYYAAAILANILGGGASSRLFQEVREKRGLAYSAYCYQEAYVKGGYLMAYAATAPARAEELTKVIAQQFSLIADKGLTEKEIRQSKDQLKGGLLLSMESSANVMSKLGRTYLSLGKVYDQDEIVNKLMNVTADDIEKVIKGLIKKDAVVLAQVGPNEPTRDIRELL